ncbi:MAG: hypothetical protein H0T46_24290 [Deltaproteobacteria bacterium]|nr:hypothetical protein [Deltaproteobacteria bacterium]
MSCLSRFAFATVASIAGCATAAKGEEGGGKIDASISVTPDAPVQEMPDAAMPDAPPQSVCASTQMCSSAMMLGTVSGDSGNAKLTAMGYQSAWFRVRVTENDSNPFGLKLRVGAKITSPSGAAFDTFIYVNGGSDVVECTTTTGSTTTSGNVKTVRAEWGEGSISNGSDDGRFASIEVRPAAGAACGPTQTWSLEVEGNW